MERCEFPDHEKQIFYQLNTNLKTSVQIGLLFFLFYGLGSCGEKIEDFDGFIRPEIIQLLTANSEKSWIRTEAGGDGEPIAGDCADSLIYKFIKIDKKTDTTGYLFVKPNAGSCDLQSFCEANPDLCEADTLFCDKNPKICEDPGIDYVFAGSWYIPEPTIENGAVDHLRLSNYSGVTSYKINFITSLHLEWEAGSESTQFFEKFISE